jgi:hypothetical protein
MVVFLAAFVVIILGIIAVVSVICCGVWQDCVHMRVILEVGDKDVHGCENGFDYLRTAGCFSVELV